MANGYKLVWKPEAYARMKGSKPRTWKENEFGLMEMSDGCWVSKTPKKQKKKNHSKSKYDNLLQDLEYEYSRTKKLNDSLERRVNSSSSYRKSEKRYDAADRFDERYEYHPAMPKGCVRDRYTARPVNIYRALRHEKATWSFKF